MKKIAIVLMMVCAVYVSAQENENVKYEKKGDLVEATIYGDNGNVEQHGFFKNKKLHGTWTYFNNDGVKIAVGNYDNGVKTGKWTFYNKDIVKVVDYLNGKVVKVTKSTNKAVVYN